MLKLQVILGSTRPGRIGEPVAKWAYAQAKNHPDFVTELIDVAAYQLPLLDEPVPPSRGQYSRDHTRRWAAKIAEADAYLFVTAEYNHSIPAALKNAIDYLYAEWNDKAAGFVSYGSNGGSRAVEHLRCVMAEIRITDIREQLLLYLNRDFENYQTFKPTEAHAEQLARVLSQLADVANAMWAIRSSL